MNQTPHAASIGIWNGVKLALTLIVCAACLTFTVWAVFTVNNRHAIESGPVLEHVHPQWGVYI